MLILKEGNRRIPRWNRKVFAVAGGLNNYKKFCPEMRIEEQVMVAFRQMLELNNLKLSPVEVKGLINFIAAGSFSDHFQDQLLCEAKVTDYLGLDPIYDIGIKTGGATGGSTVLTAAMAIASGYANVALAVGWERMSEVDTRTGNYYISTAACKDFETRLGRIYSSYYAPMAIRFAQTYGLDERVRAKVAVKNHLYGYYSPYAQQPGKYTIDEVLNSPYSTYPLHFLECCAMTDGAACMLLCDEETAYKLTDKPCEVFIAGGSHTLRVADRRDMPIPLLPNETPDLYSGMRKKVGARWPGFESFAAARFAAYFAYGMAGIKSPIDELDFVETHDAFTISDIQTYGDIGLRPYGQETDYIESGDAYFGGKCPANLSGGLIGTMHAVGATGIFQGVECLWQLQKKYDQFHGDPKIWESFGKKKPSDWKSLQLANPKQGLWVSHAGVGSHVTVGILRKAF
jgi:acetyl-CoA C-acetyltransferase